MNQIKKDILIIDDDVIYQFTAKKIIESTRLANSIQAFDTAKLALTELQNKLQNKEPLPAIILLDINMPEMNGWQFLEVFEQKIMPFSQKIDIYMVTSSLDDNDIQKSKQYRLVKDYLVKPLHRETVIKILS